MENFIDETKEEITSEKKEKKESEKNKTITLQKTLFDVAESLITKLTDLQRKNAREKEKFRDEKLMLLNDIADDIDSLINYIEELHSQIDKLGIHAKRQKVLGAESKEEKVAAPIGSSPSSVCEGLPRTFISSASSVGSSPKFPEVSPTNSRRSSSPPRSSGLTFFESSSVSNVEPEVPAIADVPATVTPFHPVSPRRSLSGGSEN